MDDSDKGEIIRMGERGLRSNESLPALRQQAATTRQITLSVANVLALVAPAGFDEADREQWLAAATMALNGIPADLLRRGIEYAMLNADHPSNIVKNIMKEIGEEWKGWPQEDGKQHKPKYISGGGHVYFSTDPTDVMREAEKRADWTTYYRAKADGGNYGRA